MIIPRKSIACAIAMVALSFATVTEAVQQNAVWNGGIGDWFVPGNWTPGVVPNNGADTYVVFIDNGNGLNSTVTLNGAATVDGVRIDTGDVLSIANAQTLSILAANGLINDGQITLNTLGNLTTLNFVGTQTINGSGAIVLSNVFGNRLITDSVLTQGANHTIRGRGQLLNNIGGLVNNGLIDATQAAALVVDPADATGVVNNGTMRGSGAGGLSLAGGVFTNNNIIEALNDSRVTLLSGSTIAGGTIQTTGTGQFITSTGSTTLDGVTNEGVINIVNNTTVNVVNGITNNGNINLNSLGNPSVLSFVGSQTIGGTGEVFMNNTAGNRITSDDNVITIGLNQTIRGRGDLLFNSGGMINNGTIRADQTGALAIDPNANEFTNNGVLEATGSGGLTLVDGKYNNNTTIEAKNGSSVTLQTGVEIVGGLLKSSGAGSEIKNFTGTTTLDGVTIEGVFNMANNTTVNVVNGITNNGNINLNTQGNPTILQIVGNQTIGGSGEVFMNNTAGNRITSDDSVITNGANQTIRGRGEVLFNTGGMINNGTIRADQTGVLDVDPNANEFTNNGVLEATGSGGLVLGSGVFNNNTTIEAKTGSTVTLESGVEIIGGLLKSSGTGEVKNVSGNITLDGVSFEGVLNIANNTTVNVENGITNDGVINLNSLGNATTLEIKGNTTLSGTGEVVLGNSTANRIESDDNVFTQASGHTIRGRGALLNNTGGMINDGTIIADFTVALNINPNAKEFTNNGVVEATGTGGLVLDAGVFNNNTTIEAKTGSSVTLASGSEVIGGLLKSSGTGQLKSATGSITLDGVSLEGVLNVANNTTVNVQNGITNNASINLNSAGNLTSLTFLGSQTISGSGEVVLGPSTANRVQTDNSVVTNGASHTIRGRGALLFNTGGMINDGIILANIAGGMTIDVNAQGFVNNGLIHSETAAIAFAAGIYSNAAGGELRVNNTVTVNTGATLTNDAGSIISGDGTLTTTGTGHINYDGIIAPGNSPGILTINDTVVDMTSTSELEIEIGGLTVGTEYDRLVATGNIGLDGILDIKVINGFATNNIGETWTIVTAADITGAFLNAPNDLDIIVTQFGSFQVDYTDTAVILTNTTEIIPEPTTMGLLAIGGALAMRRKRRAA